MDLSGKTAIITGAGKGIGKEIAIRLSELGANIVVNYMSSSKEAIELVNKINTNTCRALAHQGDVRNQNQVQDIVQVTLDKFKSIDILVNNAGITKDALVIRMKDKEWSDVIDINLKGSFNFIRAVSRIMMKQRYGRIINISSIVGVMGNPGQANYAASKAGLIGLTKAIAKELAPRGITCNAIAPGFIQTEMTDNLPIKVKEEYKKNIPLNKFGSPRDVANATAFLASEYGEYITGQVLHIDGGLVM